MNTQTDRSSLCPKYQAPILPNEKDECSLCGVPDQHGLSTVGYVIETVTDRLDYLRAQIEAEQISMGELLELQTLGDDGLIPDHDLLLREWAGIPEFEKEQHEWVYGRFTGVMTCEKCRLLPLDQDDIDTECENTQ